MTQLIEDIEFMDPMLPSEGDMELEDLAVDLHVKAKSFSDKINDQVAVSMGDLVRSMNCYYSNFLEGHDTHPISIDLALKNIISDDKTQRDLQQEAKAHIAVQEKIDKAPPDLPFVSIDFIKWIHKEFCSRLPEDMLFVTNPDTGETKPVIPGEFRKDEVQVGRHIPPAATSIPRFLRRFEEAYDLSRLSKTRQVVAVAAAHHRLAWIHPFLDGNGRVIRLFSHAMFKQIGIGNSLWSVSRGLGIRATDYKRHLQGADEPRRGQRDGRGNLSEQGLKDFCRFFIDTCIDQVIFMESLFAPKTFKERMRVFVDKEIKQGALKKGSYELISEAWDFGEFARGRTEGITGYKERQAREVLKTLVERKILMSDPKKPKGPVRLNFPFDVAIRLFPELYPTKYHLNFEKIREKITMFEKQLSKAEKKIIFEEFLKNEK